MRSVYDNTSVQGAVALFATTPGVGQIKTATGPSVDTKGYNSAAIRVQTSNVGSGVAAASQVSVVAVLEESTDNNAFTAALDNTGTQIQCTANATVTAVLAAARVEGLNSNRDRYLRVVLRGANDGVVARAVTAVAVIELGRAFTRPSTTETSNT